MNVDGAYSLGGVSGYEVAYPTNITVDPSVKDFITRFYQVSDDPERNEEWVDFFAEDASVRIGNNAAEGREEIRQLRARMWTDVEARKHWLAKIFPAQFSPTPTSASSMQEAEFMLFGTVAYSPRNGQGDAVVDWAGHAKLRRDGVDAPWRMVAYRVYLQM